MPAESRELHSEPSYILNTQHTAAWATAMPTYRFIIKGESVMWIKNVCILAIGFLPHHPFTELSAWQHGITKEVSAEARLLRFCSKFITLFTWMFFSFEFLHAAKFVHFSAVMYLFHILVYFLPWFIFSTTSRINLNVNAMLLLYLCYFSAWLLITTCWS